MSEDPKINSNSTESPDEERQNRRQFFNGLGKWSAIIVASISLLRGTAGAAESDPAPDHTKEGFLKTRGPAGGGPAGDKRPWWKHSNWDKHGDSVSGGGTTKGIQ
jgi:hypothetical protein